MTNDTSELTYTPPRFVGPIELDLSRNEGVCALDETIRQEIARDASLFERYPDATGLEALLAVRFGVEADQVLVTAGGDDAIARVCRLAVARSDCPLPTALLHTPTFEMIALYFRAAGAAVATVPWTDGPFPTDAMVAQCGERCGLVALVSPNNPTGGVIPIADIVRIATRANRYGALVLVDLAYVEFAADDPTCALLKMSNIVVVRTFSKAWGLAGLRVGYAMGDPAILSRMRADGAPYAVSGVSLAIAERALVDGEDQMMRNVARTRRVRDDLVAVVGRCGGSAEPSEGNFILARFGNVAWIRDALAGLGVAARIFDNEPLLRDAIRITCPINEGGLDKVAHALETATRPEAILFDLDGVLVDVSASYRRAIIETAASFGVTIGDDDIERIKEDGDANNDWLVTQRLIVAAERDVAHDDVRLCFERLYQGDETRPGLKTAETLLPTRAWLIQLADRFPMGLVTGRPRRDAEAFLDRFDLRSLFKVVVSMDDAPSKPSPAPIRLALRELGVRRAWMVGDTVDDIVASRAAGVIPLGVNAPQVDPVRSALTLQQAGAARVLGRLEDIEELMP